MWCSGTRQSICHGWRTYVCYARPPGRRNNTRQHAHLPMDCHRAQTSATSDGDGSSYSLSQRWMAVARTSSLFFADRAHQLWTPRPPTGICTTAHSRVFCTFMDCAVVQIGRRCLRSCKVERPSRGQGGVESSSASSADFSPCPRMRTVQLLCSTLCVILRLPHAATAVPAVLRALA